MTSTRRVASRILVAVTTCGQADYTARCLKSLAKHSCDVAVIDDCSHDHTADVCHRMNVEFLGRHFPMGLTQSYNLAYRRFLQLNYDCLIISNNDVIVPDGTLQVMSEKLRRFPYVGALTRPGDLSAYREHNVCAYHDFPASIDPDDPSHCQTIADMIRSSRLRPRQVPRLYGFFFGVSRAIQPFAYSKHFLFNPRLINIGQERDLGDRASGGHICLDAFVFHHKGISTGVTNVRSGGREIRNTLCRYHTSRAGILIGKALRVCESFRSECERWMESHAFHRKAA